MEMTIWITSIVVLVLSETVLSNYNTLQFIHPNQFQFIHKGETMISNLQSLQL